MNATDRARTILDRLRKEITTIDTELRYESRFQLLVVVILSAQCTDERVNAVAPDLFEAFPTPSAMAGAREDAIKDKIASITFPNSKAEYLRETASRLIEEYEGEVPDSVEELMTLPGVGRKTAQVVAAVGFEQEALPVDTHVYRVAHRLGLVDPNSTPLAVERRLKELVPSEEWADAHHLLILHGRYTCTARSPDCGDCRLTDVCTYFERLRALPEPIDGLDPRSGTYFCSTCDRYFDEPGEHVDRHEMEQKACPSCGSMQVFRSRTGETVKRVPDYRIT